MKITICGGGALGHVCAGVLGARPGVEVSLLTGKPDRWQHRMVVKDPYGKTYEGQIRMLSDEPSEVIPSAHWVLFCLPGFAIREELMKIKPYLSGEAVVGSVVSNTGFFFFAHEVLGNDRSLFGFQRVPFIARTEEYGKSARLLGYKSSLNIAVENITERELFRASVENLFQTPTVLLASFYEASLTNSNPILHTGRLYSMWHDWNGLPYDRCTLFYKEWTEDAAQTIICMDTEFMRLLDRLPMDKKAISTLLDYYESRDAVSLARKLSSIDAFQTILAPMREVEKGKWEPDFDSRYFTEDFPFGLRFIVDLARKCKVETPCIDRVYEWGMSKCRPE